MRSAINRALYVHRKGATRAFGPGRAMSRHAATRQWKGRAIVARVEPVVCVKG